MGIVARQSIKGTLATYFGVAVGIVTTFFVQTKYLTTEEIGLVDVLLQSALLFSGLAQLGTNTSAMRYYPYFKDEEHRDHGFFGWTLIVPLMGFILFLGGFFALRNPIASFFSEKSSLFIDYIYYVIPLAFFMLYISVFETNSNLLMRIAVPNFIREVLVRLLTLAVYLLYAFRVVSLDGFVVLFCLVYVIATLVNLVYFFSLKKINLKPDFKYITKAIRKDFLFYTSFLVLAALSDYITPFVNTFFVSAKLGLAFTGIYTIAVNIVAMIEVPYRSLSSISAPIISRYMKEGDIPGVSSLCENLSMHQLLVSAFVFYLIWINLDFIYGIMPNGEDYAAAKTVVLILGASRLIYITCIIGLSVISYSKYYYLSLFFAFFLTFSAIFLNNKLIPLYGMNGAALATLFSYVTYMAVMLVVVRLVIGVRSFSIGHLKVLGLFAVLVALYMVWSALVTPFILNLDLPEFAASLLDCVAKTLVLGGAGVAAIYFWKLSPEANDLIDGVLAKNYKKSHES